jgi:hypothetical protein
MDRSTSAFSNHWMAVPVAKALINYRDETRDAQRMPQVHQFEHAAIRHFNRLPELVNGFPLASSLQVRPSESVYRVVKAAPVLVSAIGRARPTRESTRAEVVHRN